MNVISILCCLFFTYQFCIYTWGKEENQLVITKEDMDAEVSTYRLNMNNDRQNAVDIRDEDIRMDGSGSGRNLHILSPLRGLASAYGDDYLSDDLVCKSPNHFRF